MLKDREDGSFIIVKREPKSKEYTISDPSHHKQMNLQKFVEDFLNIIFNWKFEH